MFTKSLTNTESTIDSRDVIARIDELQSYRDSLEEEVGDCQVAIVDTRKAREDAVNEGASQFELEFFDNKLEGWREALDSAVENLKEFDEGDEGTELSQLKELAEQGENTAEDWSYGATLINSDYFKEYAIQLADDIGAVDTNAAWPMSCIDWDAAAEELKQDYSTVDFAGQEFYVR